MIRRFQFSLRALLIVMLLVAISLAWFAQRRDRILEEAAISRVLSKGGMIGGGADHTVTEIVFAGQRGDVDLAANLRDADLDALRAFPRLEKLDLRGRPITDAAVPLLSRLRTLRTLKLAGTNVSDDGINCLRTALPGCSIER